MNWLKRLFTNRKTQTRVSPGTYRNAVPIEEATGDDGFVRIVPVGDFPHHHDGAHAVTAQHVAEMEANFRRFSTDVLVDRDHESLWGTTRAAGWITDLEARDDGLYARVPEWTETVSSEIERREWRYFSPVYTLQYFDKQGQNIGAVLDSVALTNRPYFREGEIDAIGNAAPTPDTTTVFMEREDLIEALGLPTDATDDQINDALAKGQEALAAQAAAETGAGDPDPDEDEGVATEADVQARVNAAVEAALAARDQAGRADELVNQAVADFKIPAADREVWLNAARRDYDATKATLDGRKANSAKPGGVEVSKRAPVRSGFANSVSKAALDYVNGSAES